MSLNRIINKNKIISQLVPFELYYYFPKEKEFFQENKYLKSNYRRLIFEGNTTYTSYEQEQLLKCESSIKQRQISLPEKWQTSTTLRFLYANNFNIKRTIKSIVFFISKYFQYSFLNNPSNKMIDILSSGAFYINGRDSRFRPIIHFSIEKMEHLKRHYTNGDIVNSVFYVFDFTLRYLLLPGQIESWIIMIDVSKSNSTIGDELKEILQLLKCYYPCRLYKLCIVNVKGINSLTWSFVKLLIEKETVTKAILIKEGERRSYFDYINPSQLELKYGGLKDDALGNYFPPDYSKDDINSYLLSYEKKLHILLSPIEYDNKMANESLLYSLPIDYNINMNNNNSISKHNKQFDHPSNRQVNKLETVNLKDIIDKTINGTPNVIMEDNNESHNISHISNSNIIFSIEKQKINTFQRVNSSLNNQTNSRLVSNEETKNDITVDLHSSNCSYMCYSSGQDGNCNIF